MVAVSKATEIPVCSLKKAASLVSSVAVFHQIIILIFWPFSLEGTFSKMLSSPVGMVLVVLVVVVGFLVGLVVA